MSLYSVLAMAHTAFGTLALIAFWTAGLARKGSPVHRAAGKIYLIAMALLLALAIPMTGHFFSSGRIVSGSFLAYLLLITFTTVWLSWRAIRDRRDWPRFVGPVYRALKWANLFGGIGIAVVGLFFAESMQLIMVSFSFISILVFMKMSRSSRKPPADPRWWMRQHMNAMLGNGIATHIAFLSIGLPRLLPPLRGSVFFQNVAWLGPVAAALLAGVWLRRKYFAVVQS